MNTPFNLDEHRRNRPRPTLAPPPERYFEQLPMRVMQRVQPTPAAASGWGWLAALTAPMRTALASAVVLGSFAAAFWLTPATPLTALGSDALARVPQEQLLSYLLTTDQRITLTDLAEVPGTAHATPASTYWQASPDELRDLLDEQPTDEGYL
ncbi:hypothetical protein [Hymenobacter actinosclerus]|uniref:Uncharacterized protein n=1 Tax=Hymenobacter actinosclerus TaxID=82805 RepID=A0A1I0EZJ6_9BACT|nr:hypothetical protein [Hymenobacter actinosclerus]SET50949.1 hypothetical protein SAMN04487998_2058 [Hymenobacter actinosclerus]